MRTAAVLAAAAGALAAAAAASGAAALSCEDGGGGSLDWWAGLKHNDGTQFSAYASGSFGTAEDMAQSDSHAARSLAGVYSGGSSVNYMMYNDETPAGHKSSTHGHTKGVVAFDADDKTGFWLIHSIPRWPPVQADGYDVPTDTQKYGQSFLCLSLDAGTIDDVANLMVYNWPQVYDSHFSDEGKALAPALYGVANGNHSTAAFATQQKISTIQGTTFTQFAKSSRWGKAIGEYLISAYYGVGFTWETWRNGTGDLLAWCANTMGCLYDAFFATSLSLPDGSSWTVSQDHSKWGISDSSQNIACIGDINRQSGQFKRGGGYVCIDDSGLWNAFNAIIATSNTTCTSCDDARATRPFMTL